MNKFNKITDVVVIGAGVIGCSTAYYLAKRGIRVIVIEKKGAFCSGASGANQGGCPIAIVESPLFDYVKESIGLFKSLASDIGYDIDYQNTKHLMCCIDEKQRPVIEKHAKNMLLKGIKPRIIEGDEIRELGPAGKSGRL